ncbi:MAG: hypothetical protein IPP08_04885 [Chlorobiota bacterium]|nr:hypothetical protein [Chlorobiota bacterium]QQS67504.1 MAG: hypothetical protein IPP08_04885 [Chlorobiota bacterium]
MVNIDGRTQDELTETGFIERAFNIDISSTSFIEEIKKLNIDKTYVVLLQKWNQ